MMQPSEFFVSLEQKVQLRRHCTGRMREFVAAAKKGDFDIANLNAPKDAAELGLDVPEPETVAETAATPVPEDAKAGGVNPAAKNEVRKVVKPEGE